MVVRGINQRNPGNRQNRAGRSRQLRSAEQMIEGAGVKRVFEINAGHASCITQPHAVAQAVLAVAARRSGRFVDNFSSDT